MSETWMFLALLNWLVFISLFKAGSAQWPSCHFPPRTGQRAHDLYSSKYRYCWEEKGFIKAVYCLFNLSNIKLRRSKLGFSQAVKNLSLFPWNLGSEMSHTNIECYHTIIKHFFKNIPNWLLLKYYGEKKVSWQQMKCQSHVLLPSYDIFLFLVVLMN